MNLSIGSEASADWIVKFDLDQKKVFGTTKEVVLISHRNLPLHLTTAKLLFSGDGAAMLPDNENDVFVKDFIKVIRAAEEFHRR